MRKRHGSLLHGVCYANSEAKSRRLLAGFAVLLITTIFTLAGCDNGTNGDTDLFAGTWIGTGEREGSTMVATNGSYTESFNGTEIIRGTYSVARNTVTMTMVQLNTFAFGGADQWFNWAVEPQ